MAPTLVSAGSGSFFQGGAPTPGIPAGVLAGDLLVLWQGTQAANPTVPSGYTSIVLSANNTVANQRCRLSYKEAAAAAQQPNPEVVKEQAKAEAAMQLKQVDAQVSMQQAEIQAQGDIVKNKAELEADLQTSEAERTSKLQLEQVKQGAENQRFFAKLAQDRELALLQMGMAERESSEKDAEGKPVKKPVDATAAMMMDGLGKLGEMVAQMNAMMSAPVEIVRGADGKAMGTRKVLN